MQRRRKKRRKKNPEPSAVFPLKREAGFLPAKEAGTVQPDRGKKNSKTPSLEPKEDPEITKKKEKTREYSIYDASYFSITTGAGETFLTPFAIALGATTQIISYLASVPLLASSFIQLFAARVINTVKNRKKVILINAFLQGVLWLPIFFLPLITKNVWMLVILFSLYALLGGFITPAWNSLIGDLVPEEERGKYFGRRSRIAGFVAFLAVLFAGGVLQLFEKYDLFGYGVWFGFFIIFFVSMIARFVSLHYLKMHYEPPYNITKKDEFHFVDFLARMRYTNFGRFVIFRSLMAFSAMIAAPFFAVYILRDLQYDYFSFTLVIMASVVMSFLTMVYWGKYIDRFGNKKILVISGILIPVIPFLYIVFKSVPLLMFAEIISGFAWGGFNLATFNFIFDNVSPQKRARCVAYFNVIFGVFVFLGSIVGNYIITHIEISIFHLTPILMTFLISGILRLIVIVFLFPTLKEVRHVQNIKGSALFFDIVAIHPIKGLRYEVITSLHKLEEKLEDEVMTIEMTVKNLPRLGETDFKEAVKFLEGLGVYSRQHIGDVVDQLRRERKKK
ncbi:MAG: MFS transporter [Nanoarchaeota archaeon]